jgi:hypothetical protein
VFGGIEYRLAAPLSDYAAAFRQAVGESHEDAAFACNCILNYVYGELEGRSIGRVFGPMTFGEIACQLLNQTLGCLTIVGAWPAGVPVRPAGAAAPSVNGRSARQDGADSQCALSGRVRYAGG